MPTVDCRCDACGHSFVHLFFKGDAIAPPCPRCKRTDVQVKRDSERFMDGPGLGALVTDARKGPS